MSNAGNAVEVNFDGLVGPTHNYAGLSAGNMASLSNAGATSNPRAAALQGLAKMRLLMDLGVTQAVLPPQQRPDPTVLAQLGLPPNATAADIRPDLRPMVMSASAMWTANAATVSPSADTADGRLHITPANLLAIAHRSLEPPQTTAVLGAVFADSNRFVVHQPLPAHSRFSDEGAANHNRLTAGHGQPGTHIFVFGRSDGEPAGERFPRRQTEMAGRLIAESHGLNQDRVLFLRQSALAVDAGAFHNDVVAVVNEDVIFHHEDAFDASINDALAAMVDTPSYRPVTVPGNRVSLSSTINTYLFNSQLVTLPTGAMALIAPDNVNDHEPTRIFLDEAVADAANPISSVHTMDLRQSMRNGGGPACLRLRVVLTNDEIAAVAGNVILTAETLSRLETWVRDHYRDELSPDDLGDPELVNESNRALDELTRILDLGDLYPFQR